MASPPTANPRTRSRWDSSKASTIKSAFSRDGHTDYATKNISASRFSPACFRRYDPPKSPTRFPEDPFLYSAATKVPRKLSMRVINVAAAQLGPIQKADSREAVVKRMIALMDEAKVRGADLIVYPELALTTFFPRWYMEDQAEVDAWFEREMPNAVTTPLFERAARHQMAMSFGYAELTPDGHYFNTCILTDRSARIVGKYRKVHLPGHSEFDTGRAFQHLEKRYFEPGDLGFKVWRSLGGILGMAVCNDRRWPETYRVMGLQGVEMVLIGYNTPSSNPEKKAETLEK